MKTYDIINAGPNNRFSTNGRIVSNSGWGYNPQNLPRVSGKPSDALRNCLKAPPGHKIVVSDLSGIELRVNHFLWKTPSSMALYQADPEKADLYKDFAASLYGIPVEEVTKAQRQIGKVAHLGLGFGAGAATFVRIAKVMGGVDISLEESQKIVDQWRKAYYPIQQGWKRCAAAFKGVIQGATGDIDDWGLCQYTPEGFKLPSGRVLYYPEARVENTDKGTALKYGRGRHETFFSGGKGDENLVQALARDVIAEQALTIHKDTGYAPKLMIHDELVYVVPDDVAEQHLVNINAIMRTSPEWWPELVLWSEGDIADTYGEAK